MHGLPAFDAIGSECIGLGRVLGLFNAYVNWPCPWYVTCCIQVIQDRKRFCISGKVAMRFILSVVDCYKANWAMHVSNGVYIR